MHPKMGQEGLHIRGAVLGRYKSYRPLISAMSEGGTKAVLNLSAAIKARCGSRGQKGGFHIHTPFSLPWILFIYCIHTSPLCQNP